jgi:hypothetical protein
VIAQSQRLMTKELGTRSNWNLDIDFYRGRKTGEKPLKQARESTTDSTHI